MYKPKVFLVGEGTDNLVALEETGYVNENLLQEFLANYPDLLPGDQIDPEHPRRWLFVAREMSVPDGTSDAGRWSLDHLFLDQYGVPTFVECKRASDTRIRREVVGQMLDYAANGTEYWTVEWLRQAATSSAGSQDKLDEKITDLLGDEQVGIEEYWATVEANLQDHKVRLIFVTDRTPKELRRLVEFLNAEMKNVRVFAVEMKQYQDPANKRRKVLAPRVVGLTEAARDTVSRTRPQPMTFDEFMAKCHIPRLQQFFRYVMESALAEGHTLVPGARFFAIRVPLSKGPNSYLYVAPEGILQVYFSEGLREEKYKTRILEKLMEEGLYRQTGKWTYTADVTEDTVERLSKSYKVILGEVEDIRKDDGLHSSDN